MRLGTFDIYTPGSIAVSGEILYEISTGARTEHRDPWGASRGFTCYFAYAKSIVAKIPASA